MKKRILTLLLCAALLASASMLTGSASEANIREPDGLHMPVELATTALNEGVCYTLSFSGGRTRLRMDHVPFIKETVNTNAWDWAEDEARDYPLTWTRNETGFWTEEGGYHYFISTSYDVDRVDRNAVFTLKNVWDTSQETDWVHVRPSLLAYVPTASGYVAHSIYENTLPVNKNGLRYIPEDRLYSFSGQDRLILTEGGVWADHQDYDRAEYRYVDLFPGQEVSFTLPWSDYPEGTIFALHIDRYYGFFGYIWPPEGYIVYDHRTTTQLFTVGALLTAADMTEEPDYREISPYFPGGMTFYTGPRPDFTGLKPDADNSLTGTLNNDSDSQVSGRYAVMTVAKHEDGVAATPSDLTIVDYTLAPGESQELQIASGLPSGELSYADIPEGDYQIVCVDLNNPTDYQKFLEETAPLLKDALDPNDPGKVLRSSFRMSAELTDWFRKNFGGAVR